MKRLSSIVLTVFFLLSSLVSAVSAAQIPEEVEAPQLELTYEKAYEIALDYSKDIKNAVADIERSGIVRDEAGTNVSFIPGPLTNLSSSNATAVNTYLGASQSQISYQMTKKSIDLEKDKLHYSVIKAYNDILDSIEGKNLAEKNLAVAKKELEIVKAKFKYGLASNVEQITATQSLVEEQENLKVAESALNDSYEQLNFLLGLEKSVRPKLSENLSYNKLEMDQEDVDVLVTRIKTDSIPVWLKEQYVKLAQWDVNLYVSGTGAAPYDAKEIDLEKSKTNVALTKENLEKSIYTMYNSIQKLESSIEMMNALKVKAEEGLKVTEVQYGLGMVTELDVLKSEATLLELEKNIFANKIQHEELVAALYKPWVAAS